MKTEGQSWRGAEGSGVSRSPEVSAMGALPALLGTPGWLNQVKHTESLVSRPAGRLNFPSHL